MLVHREHREVEQLLMGDLLVSRLLLSLQLLQHSMLELGDGSSLVVRHSYALALIIEHLGVWAHPVLDVGAIETFLGNDVVVLSLSMVQGAFHAEVRQMLQVLESGLRGQFSSVSSIKTHS